VFPSLRSVLGPLLGLTFATSCLVDIKPLAGSGGAETTAGGGGSGATGPSTGATGGDGGSGGANTSCPVGMFHVQEESLNADFCIDETEVTQKQYVQFLVSLGNELPDQIPACASNTELTHTPDGTCPDFVTGSDLPVWCIDWCDARAYCEWAGKRLCKALDGTALDFDDDPVLGEWHFACSGGLQTLYPYGNEPDDTACHIDGMIDKDPVASHPACEGGYPGLFDMQGNVHEWVDACESDEPTAQCRVRGGGTYGSATQWRCARVEAQMGIDRLDPDVRTVGLRCCADPS